MFDEYNVIDNMPNTVHKAIALDNWKERRNELNNSVLLQEEKQEFVELRVVS